MAEKLKEWERDVRDLVFAREPDLSRLEVPEERQLVYRRIVRGGQRSVVRMCYPVLRAVLGEDASAEIFERFLDEAGPTTRLYRDIPIELGAWAQGTDLAPAIRELIHYESTWLEVNLAPDPEPGPREIDPRDSFAVEFCPSARLVAYAHPVHLLNDQSTSLPRPSKTPTVLLVHRANETPRWQKLPPTIGQVLAHCAELTIGEAAAALDVDPRFARSWLVTLRARGAILGFYDPKTIGVTA